VYWIGLRTNGTATGSLSSSGADANAGKPHWDWLHPGYSHPTTDLPYKHWAQYQPANSRDPGGAGTGVQECAAANASEAYGGAWGWSNLGCDASLPFMCMTGEGRRCCMLTMVHNRQLVRQSVYWLQ
jgi:hypothetical protein